MRVTGRTLNANFSRFDLGLDLGLLPLVMSTLLTTLKIHLRIGEGVWTKYQTISLTTIL